MRWKIVLIVGVLAVVAGGLALVRWARRPTTLESGRAAYRRGDWESAAALANRRLREAPGDRAAITLLARTAARRGQAKLARTMFTRLGGASAMEAEDFFLVGELAERAGNHEAARSSWTAGLTADPKNAEILDALARLSIQGGQFHVAEKLVTTGLVDQPGWTAPAEFYLATIASEHDAAASTAAHLERALALDPSARSAPDRSQSYPRQLIRALLTAGKTADADRRLRVLDAAGPDPEVSWLLSRAALNAGSLGEAADALTGSQSYREHHPLEREPAPYTGAARCASCHEAIYNQQQNSPHARGYQRAPDARHLPALKEPLADPAAPGVEHTLEPAGDRVRFVTKDHGKTYRALIEYAFGSGERGVTLIGRDEAGRLRELRLSHYAHGLGWDVTTGQPAAPPPGEGYLGRLQTDDDVYTCFACHTTSPQRAIDHEGPTAADRGIGCERCHGPGANHLEAVTAKSPDPAIAQPRIAPSAEIIALCGQCHSPYHRTVKADDPIATRFPATTLTWSRCYKESAGTFDCRTCHDPHANLATSAAYYEAKCRSCHSPSKTAATCSVDPERGCVSCHMPKKQIGLSHSLFTDHEIKAKPSR